MLKKFRVTISFVFILILAGACALFFPPGLYDTLISSEQNGIWLVFDNPYQGFNFYGESVMDINGRAGGDRIKQSNPSSLKVYIAILPVEDDPHEASSDEWIELTVTNNVSNDGFTFGYTMSSLSDLPESSKLWGYIVSTTENDLASDYSYVLLSNSSNNTTTNTWDNEVIQNGSFGQGTENWNYNGPNFIVGNYGSGYDPSASLDITNTSTTHYLEQSVNGNFPAGNYSLSFIHKEDMYLTNSIYLEIYNDTNYVGDFYFDISNSMIWSDEAYSIYIISNFTDVYLAYEVNSQFIVPSDDAYVDQISLYYTGSGTAGPITGNLLANPGFENWSGALPDSWWTNEYDAFFNNSAVPVYGSYTPNFNINSGGSGFVTIYQDVTGVSGNYSYNLSLFVSNHIMPVDAYYTLGVDWKDGGGAIIDTFSTNITFQFGYMSAFALSPVNAEQARVFFHIDNMSTTSNVDTGIDEFFFGLP